MKTLLRRLRDALPEGAGIGAETGKSWGGCGATIATRRGVDYIANGPAPHVCAGHKRGTKAWQHACRCGFRWAA